MDQNAIKTVICSVCKKAIPESEAVKKLRGALLVCKECDEKDKKQEKSGETCEFC
ncbi:MAG: hypothetical protein AAB443_02340 [Patescibacteria group bacterium]